MSSLQYLSCHNSVIIKRSGFIESKYVISNWNGEQVMFTFDKKGKISGRGRQLLLLDVDLRPVLMLQVTELSAMYPFGMGSAQMTIHSLPGGNFVGKVVMLPGVWKGDYQVQDESGRCIMTFKRKEKFFSFGYKFKNASGVPIGRISSLDTWTSSQVRVDFHPGLDNRSRIILTAAAFLVTKVEVRCGTI